MDGQDETGGAPRLLVIGGTGAVGRRVVAQALAQGYRVRAADRSDPGPDAPREGVDWVTVDVLEDDLTPLAEGCVAVISALGLTLTPQTALNPPPLYTEGTRAILRGMRGAGVLRLVVISASFVETVERGPVWFRASAAVALGPIFAQMGEMETILTDEADGIDWTAVRPGWLMESPPSGDYRITEDVIPEDLIRTRTGDLADFMITLAGGSDWVRQTPAIARAEPPEAISPMALANEMLG